MLNDDMRYPTDKLSRISKILIINNPANSWTAIATHILNCTQPYKNQDKRQKTQHNVQILVCAIFYVKSIQHSIIYSMK